MKIIVDPITKVLALPTAAQFFQANPNPLEFANVKNFGATGNGTTDDTVAVQAAMDASNAVYFPAGVYLVSNLTPNNNNYLYGDGLVSRLLYKSGSTGYMIYGIGVAFRIHNLNLDGGNAVDYSGGGGTQGSQSGIHFDSTTGISGSLLTDCFIHGFNNIGVGLNGTASMYDHNAPISNNTFDENYCSVDTGPGGSGHDIVGAGVNGSEYLAFIGNHLFRSYYPFIFDSGNITVTGNIIANCWFGLFVNGSATNGAHSTFGNNLCNHVGIPVTITSTGGNTFTAIGNTFIAVGIGGWTISNSDGVEFIGNQISGGVFFNFSGTETVTFSHNTFYNTPYIVNNASNLIWQSNWNKASQSYINLSSALQVDTSFVSYQKAWANTGSQLVTDGSFSGTSAWTLYQAGWTIAGNGYAASSGGSGIEYQALSISTDENLVYAVTYTISNCVSGSIQFGFGGPHPATPSRGANGTFTDYLGVSLSNVAFSLISNAFNGRVTGITVYQVLAAPGTLVVPNISLSSDTSHVVLGNGTYATIASLYAAEKLVTNAAPTTGQTVNAAGIDQDELIYIQPAGTLLALTIELEPGGGVIADIGDVKEIFISQIITGLTVQATGGTVRGTALTTSSAVNGSYEYIKVASTDWLRIR